jgi:hypothetical protein
MAYHRLAHDLEFQVKKRNELSKLALRIFDQCVEILTPYVDKKICKKTPYTTWIKELKERFDGIELGKGGRLVFDFTSSCIMANVDICFEVNDRTFYKKQWFTIAILHDDGRLCSLMDRPESVKTDYVASEVEDKIVELYALQEKIYQLKKEVQDFEF